MQTAAILSIQRYSRLPVSVEHLAVQPECVKSLILWLLISVSVQYYLLRVGATGEAGREPAVPAVGADTQKKPKLIICSLLK